MADAPSGPGAARGPRPAADGRRAPPPEAFFLPAEDGGRRLCVLHRPAQAAGRAARGALVYLHPFAEEMNRSRRMAALQSRAFADAGFAVLQIDLKGCGDSDGDFGDAAWSDWRQDARRAGAWMAREFDAPLWWWGLRSGALLACDAAGHGPAPAGLLLWQPVLSGAQQLSQFLRLARARQIVAGPSAAAGPDLRAELAAGRAVEVAGYRLSPALAAGLGAAGVGLARPVPRVLCCEVGGAEGAGAEPSPALQAQLQRWRDEGCDARATVVAGTPFWHSAEPQECPALLAASVALVAGDGRAEADRRPAAAAAGPVPDTGHATDSIADAEGGACAAAGFHDEVLAFDCAGERLTGIASCPERPGPLGVLFVVGGPQYRAGSHRQFVLLARRLAAAGVPALRFDYRGMGDGEGAPQGFESVDEDIAAARAAFGRRFPGVRRVALWGLCDGASAALLHLDRTARRAPPDEAAGPDVAALCLLNPWVRSEASLARTHVRHYYLQRLAQPDFWRKLLGGGLAWRRAAGALLRNLALAAPARGGAAGPAPADFRARMAAAWRGFGGPVLLVLSENDFTAREFLGAAAADPAWAGALDAPGLRRIDVPGADHTFSSAAWRAAVEDRTLEWIADLRGDGEGAVPRERRG
ncbi:MAG: hydrolase 1, exosortase A system-associated [Xylophilus ampelinus]